MKKYIKKILIIFLSVLVISIICILQIQESMFFYPWHDETSYNLLKNEENFEEITIDNNGKVLNGWLKYNVSNEETPLVIFFLR